MGIEQKLSAEGPEQRPERAKFREMKEGTAEDWALIAGAFPRIRGRRR